MARNDGPTLAVPTLRQYAFIADGERGALIDPQGEVAWLCFPSWDGGGIFNALQGGPGSYRVSPAGRSTWGGYYEEGTLIWRSRWVLDDGTIVESRDALCFPAEPGRLLLLREVRADHGHARVRASLDVRAEYGRAGFSSLRQEPCGWTGRSGDLRVRWTGLADATVGPGGLSGEFDLKPGQTRDLVLEVSAGPLLSEPPPPRALWEGTVSAWTNIMPGLDGCAGRRDARHAYAILSALTSASGGMAAACTTSIPERVDSGRRYDYRYAWVRDQAYAGQAAAAAGATTVLDSAVRFICDRLLSDGAQLRPVYTTRGGQVPPESFLDHLPGYPGGARVTIGNPAGGQFQLDAFGEALLLFAAAARQDRVQADTWRAVEVAASAIEARWQEPDAGIWELKPQSWTHSRLVCAAGLRQVGRVGPASALSNRWLRLADDITADVARSALHPTGRWQRAAGDARVDASLLLASIRGAVAADDPRSRATLDEVLRDLTRDGYCYRYRPDMRPLGQAEGSFNLCGFWCALALLEQGDMVAAGRWFERTRAACGPPGIFSEEYDVTQRELRGNLPQAFVHAVCLECAARLGAALG